MRILGLDFFDGSVAGAVDRALAQGGLIVAPSGTCFRRLQRDEVYRRAMTAADLILPDSGFMVLLWRLLRGKSIPRISGLAYLKELLGRAAFREENSILWILPNESARDQTLQWLQARGFSTTPSDFYIAPIYGERAEDPQLLAHLETRRAGHLIIALSGGVQEKLGFYLREKCLLPSDLRSASGRIRRGELPTSDPPADGFAVANRRPAIHCIGAALGFIAGYQVPIPDWADRLYLGWLFRLIANPRKFLPRALSALALPGMIVRFGKKLPTIKG